MSHPWECTFCDITVYGKRCPRCKTPHKDSRKQMSDSAKVWWSKPANKAIRSKQISDALNRGR